MPVWIQLRVPELRRNPVFQLFRYEMFQPLRFLVDFIPAVIQYIMQKTLQQAMMPQNFKRPSLPGRCQARPVMLLVFHQRWFAH